MNTMSMLQGLSGVGMSAMTGSLPGLLDVTQPSNAVTELANQPVALSPEILLDNPQASLMTAAPVALAGTSPLALPETAPQFVQDMMTMLSQAQDEVVTPVATKTFSLMAYLKETLNKVVAADKLDVLGDIGIALAVVGIANGLMILGTHYGEKFLDDKVKLFEFNPIIKQRIYAGTTLTRSLLIAATMITSGILVSDSITSTATGIVVNITMAAFFLPKIVSLAWNRAKISSNKFLEPGNYVKVGGVEGVVLFTGPKETIVARILHKETAIKESVTDTLTAYLAEKGITKIDKETLFELLKVDYKIEGVIVDNAKIAGDTLTPYPIQFDRDAINFVLDAIDQKRQIVPGEGDGMPAEEPPDPEAPSGMQFVVLDNFPNPYGNGEE